MVLISTLLVIEFLYMITCVEMSEEGIIKISLLKVSIKKIIELGFDVIYYENKLLIKVLELSAKLYSLFITHVRKFTWVKITIQLSF
jgi:hypothetical protein